MKANGEKESFALEKLEHSLIRAGASGAIMAEITKRIIHELEEGMTTHEIYTHAFKMLHEFEKPVAIRYSLRKALVDLGPTGFPFERFIAEIFKFKGYETRTDQMVKGFCVEHEVDVVAWKPDGLIMSEVKFHNQTGLKSDLKIVLYVKARFEDLEKVSFNLGGKEMPFGEGWLITNTKFTISAVKYAECQNMKIVGWNYPLKGNLQDLVEEAKLHPITCLQSLSDHDKHALLQQNVILCSSIKENPALLKAINLAEANIEAVLEEISHIYPIESAIYAGAPSSL